MKYKLLHNRKKVDGPALVQLEIYFSRKSRVYLSTGVKVANDQWDNKNKKVIRHSRSFALNHRIKELTNKIDAWERDLLLHELEPTAGRLKRDFGKEDFSKSKTFNDFLKNEIKKQASVLAKATYDYEQSVSKRLDEFEAIYFHLFDRDTVERYHNFLLRYMKASSTGKSHKIVRKYCAKAVADGLMRTNPYTHFKLTKENTRRTYLTTDELQRIREYKGNARIEKVRDLFLFMCLTGLAYVDMQALMLSDIHESNGAKFIQKYRQKSDSRPQMIPLMPEALQILDKYSGETKCFPGISNQKLNVYLKELAAVAKIDKTLTSHVGRHTFATLMLEKGLALEHISHMLGHTNTKTTSIYAKMQISGIQNSMKRLQIEKL